MSNPPVPASLQHAYVKSVRLGDVDVLNNGLRLQGPVAASLEIVIGTTTGAFGGTVLTGRLPAGPGITVALLPDVRRRTDLYKTTTTDPAGRFHMDHVPPGSYRAFAWQDVSDGAWHDPDFMQAHEARGATAVIDEGAHDEHPADRDPSAVACPAFRLRRRLARLAEKRASCAKA